MYIDSIQIIQDQYGTLMMGTAKFRRDVEKNLCDLSTFQQNYFYSVHLKFILRRSLYFL